MPDHLICLIAEDGPTVPARVCGLLTQRNVDFSSVQMSRMPNGGWRIQLVVHLGDAELELTVIHIGEVARLFGAEVLEVDVRAVMLHLSADPASSDQFLALLESAGIARQQVNA